MIKGMTSSLNVNPCSIFFPFEEGRISLPFFKVKILDNSAAQLCMRRSNDSVEIPRRYERKM